MTKKIHNKSNIEKIYLIHLKNASKHRKVSEEFWMDGLEKDIYICTFLSSSLFIYVSVCVMESSHVHEVVSPNIPDIDFPLHVV